MAGPLIALGVARAAFGAYAARERGRSLRQQGAELEAQADIEKLNAKIVENDLRDQLMRTLSSNSAAAAASGVSGPSVAAAAIDDSQVASRAVKIRNLESLFKVSALKRQARGLYKEGKAAIIGGTANAILGGASTAMGTG